MEEQIKRHISFSEFRLFNSCEFKHYLQKILKIQEPTNEFLIFGSALHSSLEEVVAKNPNKILYEKIFAKYLEAESNEVTVKGFFGRNLVKQGTEILKALDYFERFKDWEVVGIEDDLYEFLLQHGDIEIYFKGFIDLILKKGDKYLIIDWKSAFRPWDLDKKKEDKTFWGQLALYKHFYSIKYNIPLENIETRFVALAREPTHIQQYSIEVSKKYMDLIINGVKQAAVDIIDRDLELPIKKAKHSKDKTACQWCFFNKSQKGKEKLCNDQIGQIIEKVNEEEKTF